MLETIFKNTSKYRNERTPDEQKSKGQFFTSLNTVKIMGEWYQPASRKVRILDPGAGNGSLAAAVVEHLVDENLCDDIDVTYVENDDKVLPVLKETIRLIEAYCQAQGVNCRINIIEANYILEEIRGSFDIVICNPPYKKIRKDSPESVKMEKYVHGQPNIYALFMAKSVELLEEKGAFIFITPRSWTSGNYFSVIRAFLSDNLSFEKIHIFKDRDKSFSGETVLQETMILFATKQKSQTDNIEISISRDDLFDDVDIFAVKAVNIKNAGKERYLFIPSNTEEAKLIGEMNALTDTFSSLGYEFKTGPVVEFRNREMISSSKKPDFVPMYRSLNITDEDLVFPAATAKAQYVSAAATNLLIKNENTVLVRRLSAKEDNKRIQSCIYYRQGENPFISVENHVNYAVRKDGKPLSSDEVEWIHSLLSSREYDTFFRLLNGSTQVNASELNYLPVRSMVV